MKTKNNQTTLTSKDIRDVLTIANFGLDSINFIMDYWHKTPEEREEVNENTKRTIKGILDFIYLYLTSPINEQKAIMVEILKLGEKQAVADLHKILGINTYDDSNEMTFSSPYQYHEDVEKGDPQQ